ncbi:MAG: glycoside hydrolase family 127 protein, partial [Muribaculaceae bacterium]|nr:glycoside hydrolase family 127 protein [Muribaculaceae bacterium]
EYTGKQEYLDAARNAILKMERYNMLADGVNSSSEALAGQDPLASHETCDIADYTWSIGYMLLATGEAQWADRIEKAMFNAALGAITKDFRSMQYFSCPNQVIATGTSNHNDFKYGSTWMAYRPVHETECCIGNLHRYFPNYAARMWLTDRNGAPVAAMYGPSSADFTLPDGTTAHIDQLTAYPFSENVEFRFTFSRDGQPVDAPVDMDFTYRLPGWMNGGNAEFRTIHRQWNSGDTYSIHLPMEIAINDSPGGGITIERGPLLYALPIEANIEEDTEIHENLAGKQSANPDFKSWNMTPAGKWNYAIDRSRPDLIHVSSSLILSDSPEFPFDLASVPVKITVPVVGVQDWTLAEGQFTPPLPDTVKPETHPNGQPILTTVDLVPYGATTLRLTTFPVYSPDTPTPTYLSHINIRR